MSPIKILQLPHSQFVSYCIFVLFSFCCCVYVFIHVHRYFIQYFAVAFKYDFFCCFSVTRQYKINVKNCKARPNHPQYKTHVHLFVCMCLYVKSPRLLLAQATTAAVTTLYFYFILFYCQSQFNAFNTVGNNDAYEYW